MPNRPDELFEFVQILLYADDMAIVCQSPQGLSQLVLSLDRVTQDWHLDISQPKTKVLSVDRNNTQPQPSITLRGVKIAQVEEFTYLGRTFSTTPDLSTEIASRLKKASRNFWRLAAPLYRRPEISVKTKVRLFNTTVMPSLLYGSETWAPLQSQVRRLETFQMRCLRYILGIRYATHGNVSHKRVRRRTNVRPIADVLRVNRLRWLGHLARMSKERLPLKALCSRLDGNRPRGRPFSTWRQQISKDLASIHQSDTWFSTAQERLRWRDLIHMEPQSLLSDRSTRLRRSTRLQRVIDSHQDGFGYGRLQRST